MKIKYVILFMCCIMTCYAKFASQTSVDQEIVIPDSVPRIFIDLDYYGDINLYEDSLGLQVKKIFKNPTEEEFNSEDNEEIIPILVLLDKSDRMFKVILVGGSWFKTKMYEGWIEKLDYLGIYDRLYSPEIEPIILYSQPNIQSSIVAKKFEYDVKSHIVVDFHGLWLKVKIKIDGKYYTGWLSPDQQCDQVYTTCS